MRTHIFNVHKTYRGIKAGYSDQSATEVKASTVTFSNWARQLELRAKAEEQPYYALEVEVFYSSNNGRPRLLGKFINGEWHVKQGKLWFKTHPTIEV